MEKSKLWTRDFLMGTLINFFLLLNYYLLMVVITEYSMEHFGASPSSAGLGASIFVIGALIARVIAGRWMERVGRKKTLIAGTVLEVLMSVLYFVVGGMPSLFLVRFLHGISYGVASTAIGTVVTDIVPRDRQGEGIGYYMLSVTMGAAIGPFLGMFLINRGGFFLIFVMCSAAAVLCFLNAAILRVPEVTWKPEQHTGSEGFRWDSFFEGKALPISIVCALIYFCYSSLLSFLTSFAAEIHLETAASFFFVVYALAILVSRPFTGRLFDVRGERITMIPAFLAFTVGMVVLSQTHHGVTLLLAAAFLGFGVGVVQSCGLAIAVQTAPQERLSLVNSTFYIFLDVGVGIGPLILGILIPFSGYRGMYFVMAGVAVLCLFLYHIIWKRKQNAHEAIRAAGAESVQE